MREPVEPVKAGREVEASLTWQADEAETIRPGARVEATDGALGVVRDRRLSQGAQQASLVVATDDGEVLVPEQFVRETRGDTVFLSLPAADVRAQSAMATRTS